MEKKKPRDVNPPRRGPFWCLWLVVLGRFLDLVLYSRVKKAKGCKSPNGGGCRDVNSPQEGYRSGACVPSIWSGFCCCIRFGAVKKAKRCKSPNKCGCRDVHPPKTGAVLVLVSWSGFEIWCCIVAFKRPRDGNPPIGVVVGMYIPQEGYRSGACVLERFLDLVLYSRVTKAKGCNSPIGVVVGM